MLVDDSTEELSKVIVENNVNKYAHNIDFYYSNYNELQFCMSILL